MYLILFSGILHFTQWTFKYHLELEIFKVYYVLDLLSFVKNTIPMFLEIVYYIHLQCL